MVFSFLGRVSTVSNQTAQEQLVAYLFTNYSSNLIPICSPGENVTLTLDLALRQIMNMVRFYIVLGSFQFLTTFVFKQIKTSLLKENENIVKKVNGP